MKYTAFSIALLAAGLAQAADPQWKVQYFYDKLHETLNIEDLTFPSAQRGIAVGEIVDETGDRRPRATALVTADGGEHWTLESLRDTPRSIFFLNDTTGWMVGEDAIWFSNEAGVGWKKIAEQKKPNKKEGPAPEGGLITRVWFLDEHHGFAAGNQKSAFETKDGGKTWVPIDAAAQPATNPAHAAYTQIAFSGANDGLIMGGAASARAEAAHLPGWMEPERAVKRRPSQEETMLIETHDGGKTWHPNTAQFYGSVIGLRLADALGWPCFPTAKPSSIQARFTAWISRPARAPAPSARRTGG